MADREEILFSQRDAEVAFEEVEIALHRGRGGFARLSVYVAILGASVPQDSHVATAHMI
jgi:hypothetical protein